MNVNNNNNNGNNGNNDDNDGNDEGNTALRGFLNELFLERIGVSSNGDDDDCFDSDSDSDSDSVSVSSDESSCYNNNNNNNNNSNRRLRRLRYRQHHHQQQQRMNTNMIYVAPDNARVIRTRSSPLGRMSSTSASASTHNIMLSNSVHSLNSSISISNNSISNWRNSQRSLQSWRSSHHDHRDSRWSSSTINNTSNNYGMNPRSLHKRKSKKKNSSSSSKNNKNKNRKPSISTGPLPYASAIDSVVALVTEEYSSGEDHNDDNDSMSSSSVQSFATTSTNGNGNSNGNGIDIGHNKNKNAVPTATATATATTPSRVAVLAAATTGDMPRIPQRTRDCDYYEQNHQKPKTIVNHSVSNNVMRRPLCKSSSTPTLFSSFSSSPEKTTKYNKKSSHDPVGRWAAMITTKGRNADSSSSSLTCPALPRRFTSGGGGYDKDKGSDSDSDSDDGSLIAEAASLSMMCDHVDTIKKLLPPTRRLTFPMTIPESLRRLPHDAFSSSRRGHPGRSLSPPITPS